MSTSSKTQQPTFATVIPVTLPDGKGSFIGYQEDITGHLGWRVDQAAASTGEDLPPSQAVHDALQALQAAKDAGNAAVERYAMLDERSAAAQREAIAAVKRATISGGKAEEVKTFDLAAARLAAKGEVEGHIELIKAARAKLTAAAEADQAAFAAHCLAEMGPAHTEALRAARAAAAAIGRARAAREVVRASGTRLKPAKVNLDKTVEAIQRAAFDLEAGASAFEIDETPVIVCYPTVQERRVMCQPVTAYSTWSERSAWIYRLEREEKFKFTAFTSGWPPPPAEYDVRVPDASSSYYTSEDYTELVERAGRIGSRTGASRGNVSREGEVLPEHQSRASSHIKAAELLPSAEPVYGYHNASTVKDAGEVLDQL